MIADGETNSSEDVNQRFDLVNGTANTTHIDTTDFNVKTIVYKDAAGATLRTETHEYVSIKELSNMNATVDVEYWAESGDASNPTYQTTITYVKEGTGSGSFGWTNSSGTATWTNTQSYGNLSSYDNGYSSVWCYITSACYSALSTNGVRMRIGSDSSNYLEFYFPKADLVEGWNYLECDFDNPDATSGTVVWSGIDYNVIQVYEASNSTIYFDNYKVYDYADTQISGSDYFQSGRVTYSMETKTIIVTTYYGGSNYGGTNTSGGF